MASIPPLAPLAAPSPSPPTALKPRPLPRHARAIAPNPVPSVVLGNAHFPTWYPSFYPEELVGRDVERLYVCKWCFRYAQDLGRYVEHTRRCEGRAGRIRGRKIYEHGVGHGDDGRKEGGPGEEGEGYEVWEVDGEEEKLFAQNLSLFAKLFLDTKSVFFEVGGFWYYLLVRVGRGGGAAGAGAAPREGGAADDDDDDRAAQVVGFFSKEKMSWDDNNLACILVFPPWQRRGLGKILMGVSYELGRREGRIGGPEKPLSELGRKGYLRFWEARVAAVVLAARAKSSLSLEAVAERSWMLVEDVVAVLREMGVLEVRRNGGKGGGGGGGGGGRGGGVMVNKEVVRTWVEERGVVLESPVRVEGFLEMDTGE